jgi:hypothetical protein
MNADYEFEIIVAPEDGSTGENLVKVLNCLEVPARFPVAVVTDVECNGDRTWVKPRAFSTTTQEVLNYAKSVGQFDWGTFFFFRQPVPDTTVNQEFDALFAEAELTVRAVDDTYFYIYSQTEDDVIRLGRIYQVKFERKRKAAIMHPT